MDMKAPQTPAGMMQDACATAQHYLIHAVSAIDARLGEGYAAKHPELINGFMQAAALDYQASLLQQSLGFVADDLKSGLDNIATALAGIASELVTIADRV